MGRPTNTPERFWSHVDRRGPDECWPWLKTKNHGYGRIDMFGVIGIYTHRIAYFLANPGVITLDCKDGIYVLHKCDNPPCCNPKHLYVGTHAQNMADKTKRGRSPDFRGPKGPRAKLTEEDVMIIRYLSKRGATKNALALLFDVSAVTIKGVRTRRHYY